MRLLITTQTVDKDDPILGFFHGWILEFAKHFEHISVICLKEGAHALPKNVQVYSLGKEGGENRLKYLVRFYRFFWSTYITEHVDYVFFHMGAIHNVLALPFFLMRKIRHTKFFWWKTHGKVGKPIERLALLGVDTVFTAGDKSFEIHTSKRCVVGHAIDTEQFKFQGSERNTQSLLMVGRIVPIKKIEVALRVMEKLKTEANESTYSLYLIGSADSAAYESSLREFCMSAALENVYFLGSKKHSELSEFYHKAGILLHPAYEAGFDKVVLEAMSSGVIPLTSIPSFEKVLSPLGLYIGANDADGYIKALMHLEHMNTEEYIKLQMTLREYVTKHHSLSTLPTRLFGVA